MKQVASQWIAVLSILSRLLVLTGVGVVGRVSLAAHLSRSFGGFAGRVSRTTVSPILLCAMGMAVYSPLADAAAVASCLADTTQSEFQAGVSTNIDLNTSPGDAMLAQGEVGDQQNTAGTSTGTGFGATAWTAQTFIAGVSGRLVKADVQLFCNGCGATPPNLTLSVRATSGGLPTGADLASTTIPGSNFASGSTVSYTATFGVPVTLASGTQYALILRPVSVPAGSGYFWIRSSPSTYASGSRVLSADSGGTWSTDTTRDYNFKTYIDQGYAAGNLVSSLKDAGAVTNWDTLSWTASRPAGTSLQFQVAAANNAAGPFDFVGPNGTAATYFQASGASLSQFNGFRYLKYKAYLDTADNTATPTLNDATVCFLPQADLSITKSDGVTTAVAGASVTYTIVASNAGPSNASGVTVADTLPAVLSGSWTCVGAGGGSCTASGTGNINDTVNLPVGGSVTYTVAANINASATGTLANTATVSAPSGITDPNLGNNSATDVDTLTAPAAQRTGIQTQQAGVTADLAVQGCSSVDSAVFISAPAGASGSVRYPLGLIDFSLSGCSSQVTVTTTYSQDLPAGATFYKEQNGTYSVYAATLGRNFVTFTLTDNGLGDSNPAAGVIHDPSGIGVSGVAAVPTLAEWSLMLLAAVLVLLGGRVQRSRAARGHRG